MESAGEIVTANADAVPDAGQPVESFLPSQVPNNRRTRLAGRKDRGDSGPDLPPKIHNWLIRTTRIHAHLTYIVRSFARPAADTPGDTVEARAERRDRTLLDDCWSFAMNELAQLQAELAADMEPDEPTTHRPGTPGKIETLAERAARLQSLFHDRDAGP